MWRNTLVMALRQIAHHRAYAAITIGGLALGLAGCLLSLGYVRYEQSYDSWLPDGDRIYQVQTTIHPPGQPAVHSQASSFPLDERLPDGFAEVEAVASRPGEIMAALGEVWHRFEPEIPFEARFADDIVAEFYAAERARTVLFAAFSILAILIACLGLYSLASFTTERRTKEIGIRKVLGAKVRDIVRLLVWQFCKPVVLANLIAWPVAWWAMRDWLNGFDARIPLGPSPFALAGLIVIAIAILTVASHSLRVARTNPIHALRYE